MADLNKQIQIALIIDGKQAIATLDMTDAGFKKVVDQAVRANAALNKTSGQITNTGNSAKQAVPGVNQMNMAIMQTGYVMNDAQMFLVNFRMGMMGVANNIPMIVQNFMQAKAAATGSTTAMQLLTQSLTGAGGLILGINALMFVLNVLPMLFSDTTDEVKKEKDEVQKLTEEYSKLTKAMLTAKIAGNQAELARLGATSQQVGGNPILRFFDMLQGVSDEDKERVKQLNEQNRIMQEVLYWLGDIDDLENNVNELKQKQNDLNEENYNYLVQGATSLDDAKAKLSDQIDLLEEKLKWEKDADGMAEKAAAKRKKELDEQQRKIKETIDFLGKAPIKGVRSLLFPDEGLESTGFETTSSKVAEGKASFAMQLKDTEILYAKHMANLKDIGEQGQRELADSWQNTIGNIGNIIGTLANAYSGLFNAISANVRDELNEWEDKEKKKLDAEREAALKHARTQKQRERINEQFDAREEALEEEKRKKAEEKLATWFAFQKGASISQAIIATYVAANEQLTMKPVGPWNIALAAAMIAAGLTNVATIIAQPMPGYAKGGAVIGENGPEIIAPFQDYASGQSKLIAMTMMTVRDEIRSGRASNYAVGAYSNNDGQLLLAINKLNKNLENPIPPRISKSAIQEMWRKGDGGNRRGKI
jgi:hypothetical protein